MSDTYIITAKTVEEAIAIANREYADETHEVSYEIIDMPKKGFLGIGAKDAKIKITVSKSVSSELDSLVADLRGMKVLTAKGDSGESRRDKKPREGQPKQNAQKTDKPQQKTSDRAQNGDKAKQNPRPAQEKPASDAKKPAENAPRAPRGEKPAQPQNKPADRERRADKPQQAQPKAEQSRDNKQSAQPKPQKPAKPVENQPEKVEQPKNLEQDTKVVINETVQAPVAAPTVPASEEKPAAKSSLRNQAPTSRKRPPQKKTPAENNIESSGITVSTPMGLTDFVAEESTGFGSASTETKSSGRMNNDIRRGKKKGGAPASTAPGASAKIDRSRGESTIYSDRQTAATRYDVAESDEDYRKLDRLEDRDLTIDEIRASVKKKEKSRNNAPKTKTEIVTPPEMENSGIDAAEAGEEIVVKPAEKTRREAVSEAEMAYALEFANTLLKNMKLDASAVPAACPEGEEFDTTDECTVYPKINIIGDDTGILIGHHGETLDAIQYLVNLSALRKSKQKDGDYVKIVVDIENYREKREETLRALARRMAARALRTKRNVFLEPMNAYERRIIHSELQNVENVDTHSVGADRDRKIIITYEGEDKAPDKPNRRRRGGRGRGGKDGANRDNVSRDNAPKEAVEESEGEQKERRRPKKVQKMPIEMIGEILPDGEE